MEAVLFRGILPFVAGLAWWSLLEYLLHRFALHRFPRSLGARHLGHHGRMAERRLAVAPLASSLTGGVLHGVLLVGLLGRVGWFAVAGILAGYLSYELVHWQCHYGTSKTSWMKALRRHHMLHHHRDPGTRFGVTSPLWDWLLGTLP